MRKILREYLEKTAKQTILIHRSDTLIKLILRTIVSKLNLEYAAMAIYDKNKDEYVIKISRTKGNFKIPPNFLKITKENPIVKYFTNKDFPSRKDHIFLDKISLLIKSKKIKRNPKLLRFLEDLKFTLLLYRARACIAGFFGKDLIGILFLGERKDKKKINDDDLAFLSVLSTDIVMSLKNAWLFEDLNYQIQKNKDLFLQTVLALASSIEAKDRYTRGHTERVVKYSLAIADVLKKYIKIQNYDKFKEDLRISALLHDIGKIGVPERILNKKKPLNVKDIEYIRKHPVIGADILEKIKDFKDIVLAVKHHHERYDGKGYPDGLKNKKIPLLASIIAIADAFDAMTTDRPYRKAFSLKEAVKEIKRNRKRQFSPLVVDSFLKAFPLDKNEESFNITHLGSRGS